MNVSSRIHSTAWLLAGSAERSQLQRHRLSQVQNNPPLLFFGEAGASSLPAPWAPLHRGSLPPPIHLLSLRVMSRSHTLLRLQHMFDEAQADMPGPIEVSFAATGLCSLLGRDAHIEEVSLTALWHLPAAASHQQAGWKANHTERLDMLGSSGAAQQATPQQQTHQPGRSQGSHCHAFRTAISPQDIKTFRVSV